MEKSEKSDLQNAEPEKCECQLLCFAKISLYPLAKKFINSLKVRGEAYKLFQEPVEQFLGFFHRLEKGI